MDLTSPWGEVLIARISGLSVLLCLFLHGPGSLLARHDDSVFLAGSSGLPDWSVGLVSIDVTLVIITMTIAVTSGDIIGFVDSEDEKVPIPT